MKRVIISVLIILVSLGAGLFVMNLEPEKEEGAEGAGFQGFPVSVKTCFPGSYRSVVTARGEVTPLWQTEIQSRAEGRISSLAAVLQPGRTVDKGEVLVTLEPGVYELNLAEARLRLQQAVTALLLEEQEAAEAGRNWERAGYRTEEASPLVLRRPQLEMARLEKETAELAVKQAEDQLDQTIIRAPYDGIVIQRFVHPGEMIFTGDPVCLIYGSETVEIAVGLESSRSELLSDDLSAIEAELHDPVSSRSWRAQVVRRGHSINPQTRLRTYYLQVDTPLALDPPLLPGTFVSVTLKGEFRDSLLEIPDSSFTGDGKIWVVRGDTLISRSVAPLFYGDGVFYIASAEAALRQKIVLYPHDDMVDGMPVKEL